MGPWRRFALLLIPSLLAGCSITKPLLGIKGVTH
jgi:hypothetical protein